MDPDPHSFSLLDPDPRGENLKIAEKFNEIGTGTIINVILLNLLSKCGPTPGFFTFEQSFLF